MKNQDNKNHTVISQSDGISLHFPDSELLDEYEIKILEVQISTYEKIRAKYGIWATNQNKFVKSVEDFNDSDSRHMESLLTLKNSLKDYVISIYNKLGE